MPDGANKIITSENYIEHVTGTDCIYNDQLNDRLINCNRLLHAAIGIATESGEFLDVLKKHIFYGKPFDRVNAIEECGDLHWYLGLALDDLAITMNAVLTQNIDKLRLRYPNKFNGEDAINRNIEAERKLLEKDSFIVPAKVTSFYPEYLKDLSIKQDKSEDNNEKKTGIIFEDLSPGKNPGLYVQQIGRAKRRVSERGYDWFKFQDNVATHIEEYTVPQYGDKPNDEVESWSVEECLSAVKKYIACYGKNSREGQQEIDFLKMAHFIQIAATKYQEQRND